MDWYRDSVTESSWQLLQELKRQFNFCLIGGWAVWLYTKQLKSKDIDLVVAPEELSQIRRIYDLTRNERLKKYELRRGEVQVDVYSAYYSDLGVAAEKILADCRIVTGFSVPAPETLFILKLAAWLERKNSPKGRKDLIDMLSLLQLQQLDKNKLKFPQLSSLIKEIKQLIEVPELKLNRHQTAKQKKFWLERLE